MPTMSAIPLELMYWVPVKFRRTAPFGLTSEYAVSKAASLVMSMWAGISITVTPSRRRTTARSTVSAIGPSSEPHDELDGVVSLVARDANVVDHVLDEEEAPPAGLLQAGEFRLEIGGRRLGDVATAAEIGDAHDDVTIVRADLETDRQLGAALIPVLDRIHRRLGNSGLESLEPPAGECDVADARRDAFHRLTLVAADARDLELIEHVHLWDTLGPDERDEGDVVLLLPGRAGESSEIVQQLVDQRLTRLEATDELPHSRKAEHVPLRIVRLGQAVAVQQQPLTGVEDGLLLLVTHVGHQAQRHAGGTKVTDSTLTSDVGEVMAR